MISWQKARKKCNLRKYIHRARCSNNEYSHPYLKIKIRFIWINSEHNFGWMNFIPTILAPIQHFTEFCTTDQNFKDFYRRNTVFSCIGFSYTSTFLLVSRHWLVKIQREFNQKNDKVSRAEQGVNIIF